MTKLEGLVRGVTLGVIILLGLIPVTKLLVLEIVSLLLFLCEQLQMLGLRFP